MEEIGLVVEKEVKNRNSWCEIPNISTRSQTSSLSVNNPTCKEVIKQGCFKKKIICNNVLTLITQDNSIGWYKKYPWICENCYEFHKGNRWHCEVCKADICPKCSSADASLLQNSKDENKSGNNDDSDGSSSNSESEEDPPQILAKKSLSKVIKNSKLSSVTPPWKAASSKDKDLTIE